VLPEAARDLIDLPPGAVARTVAVAPLHGLRGWIIVRMPADRPAAQVHPSIRLLAGISYQCSLAISRSLAYRGQKENAEIANALLTFGRELVVADDLTQVLNGIVWLSARTLGSPQTSVWMEEVETGDLVAEACWGYEGDGLQQIVGVRLPADVARQMLGDAPEPFVLDPGSVDAMKPLLVGATEEPTRVSYAVAPLGLDGGRIGCLAVAAPAIGEEYEFSERKMRLLAGMAHQAKLAIINASNFDNLERTFLSTVEALANALEAKDEYTSSHARDITDMSMDVGLRLGLDPRALKRLELGALFHDIGKIGIPSEILLKPGPLTGEEWHVMETHPELGERILHPIERLERVRPIVRACHERVDGRGYPDGLRGDEIPIEARIIFVCDAFHAMTTDRPYRQAMPVDEAARRLREGAGTQFDAEVVEAFLTLLEEVPSFVRN
ncbi:MAG: HD-GYP domain-containing protein, partial [Actinomycetota bacterium]